MRKSAEISFVVHEEEGSATREEMLGQPRSKVRF